MAVIPATASRRFSAYPLIGLAMVGAVWALGLTTDLVPDAFVATPTDLVEAAQRMWANGSLPDDLLSTTSAMLLALGLVIVFGVPLGTVLGLAPRLHASLGPLFGLGLSIPSVAYLSIMVLWFGFGFGSVVGLGVASGIVYLMVTTGHAVQGVDRLLITVGRVYAGSPLRRFFRIIVPGSLASLATGIRLTAGRVIVGVVVGEFFLSNSGLGARLLNTVNFFDTAGFYVVIAGIALVSHGLMTVLRLVEAMLRRYGS